MHPVWKGLWKANKSIDNFLFALTFGEWMFDNSKSDFDWVKTTTISENLSGGFKNEPLYVDFIGAYSPAELTLNNPDFKAKVVSLSFNIRNKSVGDKVGEAIGATQKIVVD